MLKFAMTISHEYPADMPLRHGFEESLGQVRAARDAAFSAVYMGQHYMASPTQMLQTVPLLARFAAEAGEMKVGTLVLLIPLHNPVHVAEEMATLDVICNGRFVFGVGLGYRDEEYQVFGFQRSERVGRFVESLEIVQRLWTEDHVTYHGRYFQLEDVTIALKPLQKPHPPIWIGASGDAAVRRAATLGFPWIIAPNATAATLLQQWDLYLHTAKAAGKPPLADVPIRRDIFVAKDRQSALREVGPYIEGKLRNLAAWGFGATLHSSDALDVPLEELVKDRFICGSPDECIEQIARYQQLFGLTEIILRVKWPGMPMDKVLQNIRSIGKDIIPHFA